MKNKKLLALPIVALSLLALAGCSAPNAAQPSPTASSTPQEIEIPTADVTCVDGVAVVTTDSTDVTIDGDCATVEINASNSQVTVGAVETLKVNGSINRVVVAEVAEVFFSASGNIVVTASDPAITDDGEHNTVTDQNEM